MKISLFVLNFLTWGGGRGVVEGYSGWKELCKKKNISRKYNDVILFRNNSVLGKMREKLNIFDFF